MILTYEDLGGWCLMFERSTKIAALEQSIKRLEEQLKRQSNLIDELRSKNAIDAGTIIGQAAERSAAAIRSEYTALPRFAYHLPLDYEEQTLPPIFEAPVWVEGEALPLPPVEERHGHAGSDQDYLEWGKYDKDVISGYIRDKFGDAGDLTVMDFGCSSGRILRHFHHEIKEKGWKMTGVDVSARRIEWLRQNFVNDFQVYTGSFLPTMPFESNSFDVIYGMSVFTHIKYLWDFWLLELRRVLKPGGLLIQSVHTEHAWRFFVERNHEAWVRDALGTLIVEHNEIPADYVYFGNLDKNQVFWKKDIVERFWGRYYREVEVFPPPPRFSYQNWVVAVK